MTEHSERLRIFRVSCPPVVADLLHVIADVSSDQTELLRDMEPEVIAEEEFLAFLMNLFTGGCQVEA